MNKFDNYRDKFGLLVKKDGDGGDTAHTTGVYYSILAFIGQPESAKFAVDAADLRFHLGRFMRHPDPSKWYSNPNNFTRDQNNPLICAAVLNNNLMLIFEILRERSRRFYFHFNDESGDQFTGTIKNPMPDAPAPVEFGLYASVGWFSIPWHWITDIQLILDATIGRKINGWDADAGLCPLLLARRRVRPTLWSRLALWLWVKQEASVMQNITKYYGEENGNNGLAPMVELFQDLFSYLKK
jgi:hypothetical protein